MLGTSIITGTMTANIKGIVIKDKQAVIAVKETDKATFPPANLVKQLEEAALGTHVIKIIPNFKTDTIGKKIINKNPIDGNINI